MRSSEFMGKETMKLSRSQSKDFFQFSNPLEDSEEEDDADHSYGPSFAFHPTRPLGASHSHPSDLRNCSSMDRIDSVKVTREEVGTFYDMALISKIDQTMKDFSDNLLHAVEGLIVRLSQLESKTSRLENAVNDLKVSAEYNYGRTYGKLRQLEIILGEVQDGVQFVRDKQEIAETQLHLAKLQVSKGSPRSEDQNSVIQTHLAQRTSSPAPQQSHQPLPSSGALPPAHPTFPPNMQALPYQNLPPTAAPVVAQFPTQIPQNELASIPRPESYYPLPGQTSETACQQYHMPTPQAQPPSPATYESHQPAHQLPPVSKSPQLPQMHPPLGTVNAQNHPPLIHHPEERSYVSSFFYSPTILESSCQPAIGASTQQFYVDSTQQMDCQPLRRPYSEFPAKDSHTPGPANYSDMNPYSSSLSHYGSSTMKPSQLFPFPAVSVGGSDYAELPKAKILPHALPTASIVDNGSGSGGTGNKVPIDDVVEKVTAMGFRRDLVRATVRKLAENGQSVDLNVVLDKLMNNRD